MSGPKPVGTIYKDERDGDVYLVMEDDKEVYYFRRGSFYFGLTKCADKGCSLKDVECKMIEIAERDDDKELGFV
jgi:hypothetical protein